MSLPEPVLTDAFLAARGPGSVADPAKLEAELHSRLRQARVAWPELNVDPVRFARHLGERAQTGEPLEALAELRTDDLYLVCAVLSSDARAHRLLDQHLVDRLVPALTALSVGRDIVDETQQRVRELLLLPRATAPPRLATYDGRGSLWSWARVVAVREALALAKRKRPVALTEGDGAIAEAIAEDPELRFLKGTYRAAFGRAFAAALEEIESKPRTALRLHHVDRLTLEQTADLLGVHRATAARWLSRARDQLLQATRRHMMKDLRLDTEQLDSIMEMIGSHFDVSVARLLR